MADNYLEKRMEEHRARQNAACASRPPSRQLIPFKPLRVFVPEIQSAVDTAKAIISAYASAGCTVGFANADNAEGRKIAQASGGRFYPMEIAEALEHFGKPDLTVEFEPEGIMLRFSDGVCIEVAPVAPTSARLCLLMSTPGARCGNADIKIRTQQ